MSKYEDLDAAARRICELLDAAGIDPMMVPSDGCRTDGYFRVVPGGEPVEGLTPALCMEDDQIAKTFHEWGIPAGQVQEILAAQSEALRRG